MEWSLVFFLNSVLLGVGLAMDAFSVSMANGLNEPTMKKGRMCGIAGVFAGFQAFMPMTGWICVHSIVQYFKAFERFIPGIALILLAFIGGKTLIEGIRSKDFDEKSQVLELVDCSFKVLPHLSMLYLSALLLRNMDGIWHSLPL